MPCALKRPQLHKLDNRVPASWTDDGVQELGAQHAIPQIPLRLEIVSRGLANTRLGGHQAEQQRHQACSIDDARLTREDGLDRGGVGDDHHGRGGAEGGEKDLVDAALVVEGLDVEPAKDFAGAKVEKKCEAEHVAKGQEVRETVVGNAGDAFGDSEVSDQDKEEEEGSQCQCRRDSIIIHGLVVCVYAVGRLEPTSGI